MKHKGMTLLELLAVLVICSILFMILVPAFRDLFYRHEANRITSELYAICQRARANAALYHLPHIICGSGDARMCDGQWSVGILSFTDNNRNNQPDPDEKDIRYTPLELKSSRLDWRGFNGNWLRVEAFGIPFAGNGSFTYCPGNQDKRLNRQVIVNRGGRVRLSRDTDGDGLHEGSSGGAIACP